MATTDTIAEMFRFMESEMPLGRDQQVKPSQDPQKVARWATIFKAMADEDFKRVALQAVTSRKWFPTISEFSELHQGSTEERAVMAFELTRERIAKIGACGTFFASDLAGDQHALWVVEKIGVDVLGAMTSDNRPFIRKDFVALYKAAVDKGAVSHKVPGSLELSNTQEGRPMTSLAQFGRTTSDCPPELTSLAEREQRGIEVGGQPVIEDTRPKLMGRAPQGGGDVQLESGGRHQPTPADVVAKMKMPPPDDRTNI